MVQRAVDDCHSNRQSGSLPFVQAKGLPLDTFQTLFTYSFIGIFAGARLGHCLFYDPQYFLSHPLEIILPVHFLPQGGWVFTGYAGLASHGGTLGLILALVLFCRKTKIHFLIFSI